MSHKPYKKLKKKIKKVIRKPLKNLAEALTGESWEELKHGDGAVAKLKKQKKRLKRALKGKKHYHDHQRPGRTGEKPSQSGYPRPPLDLDSLKSVKKSMKEPWSALVGGVVKGEVTPELIDNFDKLNRRFDALKVSPWDRMMPEYMEESERFLSALRGGDLVSARKYIKTLSAHKSLCHDRYKK